MRFFNETHSFYLSFVLRLSDGANAHFYGGKKSLREMDSFAQKNVVSNPNKMHHNLRYEEGGEVFFVLCIMTGKNRGLSLIYRLSDDGSEAYEKYTVSKFVNIKKIRKFRHYSDLKKACGSAAWHEKK